MNKKILIIGVLLLVLLVTGASYDWVRTINIIPSIGGFWSDEAITGSPTLTLSAANTVFNLTNLNKSNVNVGDTKFFIIDETAGSINFTSLGVGIYSVFFGASFQASRTGIYHCWVFNGGKQEVAWERNIGSANNVGSASSRGYINISSAGSIRIGCETNVGTNPTITFNHFNFNFERVNK